MHPPAHYLALAARAALRAAGHAEPNPLVGCVLVKDNAVIGIGHHKRFGGLHAERESLESCRRQGLSPVGATAYVTLEPCNAQGKQPACVDALIEAKIAKVVFARHDLSANKGGGAKRLRAAGIECVECPDSPLANSLIEPFTKRLTTGLPWVVAKWAQTIDGRIATRSGESKWISGERSRARVHRLRSRVDAILTGIGTVAADDPLLTARLPNNRPPRRQALRVIADTDIDIDLQAQVVQTARAAIFQASRGRTEDDLLAEFATGGERVTRSPIHPVTSSAPHRVTASPRHPPTLLACASELTTAPITADKRAALAAGGIQLLGLPTSPTGRGLDLRALLAALHEDHNVATVLVESGPGLLGSMLEADLIDEAVVYIAPLMLGDEFARAAATGRVADSLTAGKRFCLARVKALDGDVELTYRRA